MKYLRIAFILILMIAFLVSCHHRKQEVSAVLKNAPQSRAKVAKKGNGSSSSNSSHLIQEKLGLSSKEMHAPLYGFVSDWYGTPYRLGGCQKTGVDCSCFANILCEKVYGVRLDRTVDEIFKSCKKLREKDAREGDLLFFNIGTSKVNHVGVYLRSRWFVHASTSRGVVLSSMDEAYYKKYFYCLGRVKEG